MVKKRYTLYILFVFLFLTGCWDMIAIEKRGFIIGTAIDLFNEESKDGYELTVTNQIVIPAGLGTPSNEGSGQEAFMNVTVPGTYCFQEQ